MQVEKCSLIEFQRCDDKRGKMSVIEGNKTKDCVMLILSNEHYDSSEYIKDYNEYLREIS